MKRLRQKLEDRFISLVWKACKWPGTIHADLYDYEVTKDRVKIIYKDGFLNHGALGFYPYSCLENKLHLHFLSISELLVICRDLKGGIDLQEKIQKRSKGWKNIIPRKI